MRVWDAKLAYFFTMATNVHISKQADRIQVKDVMKQLHPPTSFEHKQEEELFLEEWEAALKGGEEDS